MSRVLPSVATGLSTAMTAPTAPSSLHALTLPLPLIEAPNPPLSALGLRSMSWPLLPQRLPAPPPSTSRDRIESRIQEECPRQQLLVDVPFVALHGTYKDANRFVCAASSGSMERKDPRMKEVSVTLLSVL